MKSDSKKKQIRMIDIAEAAGVSYAAVSAVLSKSGQGKIRVGEKKTELVKEIAKELNYKPNPTAMTLAGGVSKFIGILIDSYAGCQVMNIFNFLEQEFYQNGYHVLVGQAHDNIDLFKTHLADFKRYKTAAVIALAHTYPRLNVDIYEELETFSNVAIFGPQSKSTASLPAVEMDWENSFFELTCRAIAGGCRRITLQTSGIPFFSARQINGYKKGLRYCGLKFDPALVIEEDIFGKNNVRQLADKLLELDADAFFGEDIATVCLLGELHRRGICVPDDISLVARHDGEYAKSAFPAITALDMDSELIAKKLCNIVLQMLAGKSVVPKVEFVPGMIVVRESAKLGNIEQ